MSQSFIPLLANLKQSPWTGNEALSELRHRAYLDLAEVEFPTQKDEEWRYTSVKPLLENSFQMGSTLKLEKIRNSNFEIRNLKANKLVFVNGQYSEEHSEIVDRTEGLFIGPLSQFHSDVSLSDTNKHAFQTLNTAFFTDGFVIYVPKNVELEHPIHIVSITEADETQTSSILKNLIVLEEGAEATVIESNQSVGDKDSFVSFATDIETAPNSQLHYSKLQDESVHTCRIDDTHIIQNGNNEVHMQTFTLSGGLTRNNIHSQLQAPNSQAFFNGLYIPNGYQHVDNCINIEHQAPNCESHQLYKGLLDGQSTGVFSGKIHVHQDAQKTNAFQSNKNILLSDDAKIYAKPQLEIYADDVKCSHGETTGKIDEEAVFYLQSRGISETKARELIQIAFAQEIIDTIKCKKIREHIRNIAFNN